MKINTAPSALATPQKPRVLVLGAGFGGLTFCKKFPRNIAQITVVDRTNHHLFQPLLYQVATSGLSAPEIAHPIRTILNNRDDIRVVMDEVIEIDPHTKTVTCKTQELRYDYLVIALGAVTSYFGHNAWEQHAPGLKRLSDAVGIRHQILQAFEDAENSTDPQEREALMTMVVIGGGPTGVEMAGALAELKNHVLARDFRKIDTRNARVILVEALDRVLNTMDPKLSESARRQLEKLGVEVRLGDMVKDIQEGRVEFESDEIRAANIIWTAGVGAPKLTREIPGVETDRGGRIKVDAQLALAAHPEIFAIGDIAHIRDPHGGQVPGISPAAIQAGEYTAKLIGRQIRGGQKAREAYQGFEYFDKGYMATIGRSAGVARLGNERIGEVKFSGFFAWLAWLFIHLIFLVGFRNKLVVLIQWFYSYIVYRRGARIIFGDYRQKSLSEPDPEKPSQPAKTGPAKPVGASA